MGEELWSGWGVRTMSTGDAGYNPLSYHNGTVWPHDNSLRRAGARAPRALAGGAADRPRGCSARRPISATSCPEVFAGLPRARDAVPDRLPDRRAPAGLGGRNAGAPAADAARPRARPAPPRARDPRARGAAFVGGRRSGSPGSARSTGSGTCASTRACDGDEVKVAAMRIAVLAPPWFAVPPTGYGGIEWIVSLLADGLADAGHDVTLFASGDSRTRAKLAAIFEEAPSELIGHSFPELQHVLSCYARADEFDVVNDHTGLLGAALGGLVAPAGRAHGPRPARRRGRRALRADRRGRAAGRADLDLAQPAPPEPDLNWVANIPNALDLEHYPCKPHRGDYLLFLGRMNHEKGAHRAVAVAMELGLPLKLAGKMPRDEGARVLRRVRRAASRRPDRVPGEVNHGRRWSCCRTRARRSSRSSGRSRSASS